MEIPRFITKYKTERYEKKNDGEIFAGPNAWGIFNDGMFVG